MVSSESMDIDRPNGGNAEEEQASVHPLAVVSMSDHYTRVTAGGSPLARSAPVVGILFGNTTVTKAADRGEESTSLQILDSNDTPPLDPSEESVVALHQAVFPQQQVVGWYRVVEGEALVTPQDLSLTTQLQQKYPSNKVIFCLLQAPSTDSLDRKPAATDTKPKADDADDATLPLSLFCAAPSQKSLIAIENWSVRSFSAERIAMEHVIRSSNAQVSSNEKADAHASSPFLDQTEILQDSYNVLLQKWRILEEFLQETADGKLPFNPSLMRQVNQILLGCPLPPPPQSTGASADSPSFLQQLAILTKAVDSVSSYVTKFRDVLDHKSQTSSSSSNSRQRRAQALSRKAASLMHHSHAVA